MDIHEAWRALGEDPEAVLAELRSHPDVPSRIAAAEAALARAEKIGKALMNAHHPDRNPGDPGAGRRFIRVQEALESIRFHTEELRRKAAEAAPPSDRGPKIVFG